MLQSERPGEFDYGPSRDVIASPWHGWEFHPRTGQSWCAPDELKVSRYAVASVADAELATDAEPQDEPGAPASGTVKATLRRRDLPDGTRRRLLGAMAIGRTERRLNLMRITNAPPYRTPRTKIELTSAKMRVLEGAFLRSVPWLLVYPP